MPIYTSPDTQMLDAARTLIVVPLNSSACCSECGRPLAGDEARRTRAGFAHVACGDLMTAAELRRRLDGRAMHEHFHRATGAAKDPT